MVRASVFISWEGSMKRVAQLAAPSVELQSIYDAPVITPGVFYLIESRGGRS
jgi:hypothetical protein